MLGDETAGIGLVAPDRVTQPGHGFLDHVGQQGGATGAVAVADHHVRPPRLVARDTDRGHRMAIHQDHGAEPLMRLVDQPAQRAVIRLVQRLDPRQPVIDRQPFAIDLLAVTDHARDGAETAGHPHRAGIGETRQAARKHPGIEFVGLAVDVDIGARKVDRDRRKAALAQIRDQLVHERIFGAAQRGQVDPRRFEEFARIDRAGMRGIEDDRRPPLSRLHDLERRRQFAIKLGHRRAPSLQSAALDASILPEKRCSYEKALSVITTVLPSGFPSKFPGQFPDKFCQVKNLGPARTPPGRRKGPASLP